MKRNRLGRSGLQVSKISIGTAELGMDYGIRAPGDFGSPPSEDAASMLQSAVDAGINLFDTAPAYGVSEKILGENLSILSSCYIATKVSVSGDASLTYSLSELEQDVMQSLQKSSCNLRREVLDIVQIHNATVRTFDDGLLPGILGRAKDRLLLRCVGASVYGNDAALAAIDSGIIDVLQIPFSILDQRMATKVLPAARAAYVGIVGRSVLLKGALTPKARHLPDDLIRLREAADHVRRVLDVSWEELPQVAIRYCLGTIGLDTILLGVRTQPELNGALAAAKAGPLPEADMASAQSMGLDDDRLLNPVYWEMP